jgi:hypothetical protein
MSTLGSIKYVIILYLTNFKMLYSFLYVTLHFSNNLERIINDNRKIILII